MSKLLPDWLEEAVQEILLERVINPPDEEKKETLKILDDALSLKLFGCNVNPTPSAAWFLMASEQETQDWQHGNKYLEGLMLAQKKIYDEANNFTRDKALEMEGVNYSNQAIESFKEFDQVDLDRIRSIPIETITLQPVKRQGRLKVTLCPFHEDKTPSATLYPDHFYCFQCGKSGSAIDWVMGEFGMDFKSAINYLKRLVP